MIKEKKNSLALTNKIEALKEKILRPTKIYNIKSKPKKVKKVKAEVRGILFSQLNLGK